MREDLRCRHLEEGSLPKHSTLRFETVPRDQNTTDYEWDIRLELCVFCAGRSYGQIVDITKDATRIEGLEAK